MPEAVEEAAPAFRARLLALFAEVAPVPAGQRRRAPPNSQLVKDVPDLAPTVVAQLTSLQQRLRPADFQLCTARIAFRSAAASPARMNRPRQLGVICFSKIVFDPTQTKALLSFDWRCGGPCGFAEVLLVQRIKGRWRIKRAEQRWIS